MVDVFSFIDSAIANLKVQIKKSEASIEAALSSIESATTLPEQEKRLNVFNKILGLNEDREWHIQQLRNAEQLFRTDQLTAQQVMSLKISIDNFIKAEKVPPPSSPFLVSSGTDISARCRTVFRIKTL
jgi:hypothetical protein